MTRATQRQDSYVSIGAGVSVRGSLEACDKLFVAGEAGLDGSCGTFVLDRGGRFSGSMVCETAEIRGDFEGAISATKRLVVHDTGTVRGEIAYQELEVATGGRVAGEIRCLADAAPAATASEPSIPARRPQAATARA